MNQIVRRKAGGFTGPKPEILAPAGNTDAFLAALAAGADAIYCGLKAFSARMAAKNFTLAEMASLSELTHREGKKLYLAVNNLLKPADLAPMGRQLVQVNRQVRPDALIIQDLAVAAIARQIGYKGEIHLSTLANVSISRILPRLAKSFGIQRVVLPRELTVDEIKQMAAACPHDLGLEVFVHGALCYAVSGRCYWSSYMGGKSGLRGRCVQPCRRRYKQGKTSQRYFACQDLSLDVLARVLADVPQVRAWKIEGRKKGPHYVYYTTAAYQMLRDEGHDPQMKKAALGLLAHALGRPGTHYHFLSQRPQNPIDIKTPSGSGLMVGAVRGDRRHPYIEPRLDLLPADKLRVGYEDDAWHQTFDLNKSVPKKGKLVLKLAGGRKPAKGTPVFLIDRREAALDEKIKRLSDQLRAFKPDDDPGPAFSLKLAPGSPGKPYVHLMHVRRKPGQRMRKTSAAYWLDLQRSIHLSGDDAARAWWWLPPVIWPDEEQEWQQQVSQLLRNGARRFVINAPWQIAMFRRPGGLSLWAGPFCNLANPLAIRSFKNLGGHGAIVSPELGREDLAALANKSVLPLGVVVSGHWPFCVSRVLADDMKTDLAFTSPRGEQGWARRYGQLYWLYPNWPIDLRNQQEVLKRAGYRMMVHLDEPVPSAVNIKRRPGKWNWDIGLK
jgi:putative protease